MRYDNKMLLDAPSHPSPDAGKGQEGACDGENDTWANRIRAKRWPHARREKSADLHAAGWR